MVFYDAKPMDSSDIATNYNKKVTFDQIGKMAKQHVLNISARVSIRRSNPNSMTDVDVGVDVGVDNQAAAADGEHVNNQSTNFEDDRPDLNLNDESSNISNLSTVVSHFKTAPVTTNEDREAGNDVEEEGITEDKATVDNKVIEMLDDYDDEAEVDFPGIIDEDDKETVDYRYYVLSAEIDAIKTLYLQVLLYYFQSLSLILANKGISSYLSAVYAVCNLSVSYSSGSSTEEEGYCVIPYLSSLNKLLFGDLFQTGCIVFNVGMIKLLHLGYGDKLTFRGEHPYVEGALFRVLLVCVGNFWTLSFKILTCTVIEGTGYNYMLKCLFLCCV
jgi:hypothetical protein